jgi:hypothetical protein
MVLFVLALLSVAALAAFFVMRPGELPGLVASVIG